MIRGHDTQDCKTYLLDALISESLRIKKTQIFYPLKKVATTRLCLTGGRCFHTRCSDMARRGWVSLYSEVSGANWDDESSWSNSSSSLRNMSAPPPRAEWWYEAGWDILPPPEWWWGGGLRSSRFIWKRMNINYDIILLSSSKGAKIKKLKLFI